MNINYANRSLSTDGLTLRDEGQETDGRRRRASFHHLHGKFFTKVYPAFYRQSETAGLLDTRHKDRCSQFPEHGPQHAAQLDALCRQWRMWLCAQARPAQSTRVELQSDGQAEVGSLRRGPIFSINTTLPDTAMRHGSCPNRA
jgi:hypothetical protein